NGVQLQRFISRVAEVVLSTRGHCTLISCLDWMGFTVEVRLAGTGNKRQDLVGVLMYLIPNFSADRHRHDHNMGMFAGPECFAKIRAFLGDICDREVFDVTCNGKMSF